MEKRNIESASNVLNTVLIHRDLVKKAAKKYLGKHYADWADDITQDVMLKALKNLHKFDDSKGSLAAWIYTITKNMCLDLMAKKINGLNNFALDENFILVCDTEKPFEIKALRSVIKHALAQLSDRDRTMLMMRYYMDCSGREIAVFLEIPENQVASYMIRAKNRLKVLLDRVIEHD